ncbi:MAG: putative inorganic carbon (HCO3(-)) transporter [Bacteroidia bacterium]|jgi:putative inorganic carbon (HCO3(-)) transporter
MRDIVVTLMVLGTLPFILRNAWIGVLAWSWLSYMNPHKLTWGFAATFPFAQVVAITLLISMLGNSERKMLPANNLVYLWVAFLAWNIFCTFFAFYPETAWPTLIFVLKIQLVTFVTLILMKDFNRINQLVWVIVFSIGFYSVKGGVFTLMTGGNFHVLGPGGSYIEENNTLAVATLMIMPMMMYIYKYPPKPWVQRIMPLCIFLSMVSVVGSQSRGAILAILAVGGFYWLKSNSKALTLGAFILLALLGIMFMPDSWYDRIAGIQDFQQDASALGRLRAWEFSINMAFDRLTGGGFESWSWENYRIYAPSAKEPFVAHSIYFHVLGDSGWPGLILFVSILIVVFRQLGKMIKHTEHDSEMANFNFLARMLQVSLVAFMAGGSFLSLSYFDLAWHIMAITVAMTQLTRIDKMPPQEDPNDRLRQMPPRIAGRGQVGRGRRVTGRR